jgi:hypothetical protein
MGVGKCCDGRRRRRWHKCGGRRQQWWRRNGRRDSSAITMRDIEITVDGGGGNEGHRWHNERQDGRAAVGCGRAGRWGKSIFSMLIREIFHITGIHRIEWRIKKKEKRVRRKGFHCLPLKKVRSEGSPFSQLFSIVKKTGNTQMIAGW